MFRKIIIISISAVLWAGASWSLAGEPPKNEVLSVTGRLTLSPGQTVSQLLLYGADAKVYIINGEYRSRLESILSDLGENNLVSVTGMLNGKYDMIWNRKQVPGQNGNLIKSVKCIRLYHLQVTQINNAIKSAEKMPDPERSAEDEKIAMERWRQEDLAFAENTSVTQVVSTQARITSLELRAPIKSIGIVFKDKDGNSIKKTLFLNKDTHIVKEIDKAAIELSANSLKEGQKVFVVYNTAFDGKNTASAITIIQE